MNRLRSEVATGGNRGTGLFLLFWGLVASAVVSFAAESHPASGLVLKVDPARQSMVVSCNAIPGYMEAMTMPFSVREKSVLRGLAPGTKIDFTLAVEGDKVFAEHIKVREFDAADQRPFSTYRLRKLQEQAAGGKLVKPLAAGARVTDFQLIDQNRELVRLSQFHGKVIAISFMYTRCALPQYCFRMSNNLSQVRRRFADSLGKDLVLLTITFDAVHDRPEQLAAYAKTWGADSKTWHFLTGTEDEIKQVCSLFGVDAYLDEGTMMHSLHTAIIGRDGTLVANVEGNDFSAEQLGDLIETTLGGTPRAQK